MFIVDFKCVNGHVFEGMYDSFSQFESIKAENELKCPLCDSCEVAQVLKTGGVKTSKNSSQGKEESFEKVLSKLVNHIRINNEYVEPSQYCERLINAKRKNQESPKLYTQDLPSEGREELAKEGIHTIGIPIPNAEIN